MDCQILEIANGCGTTEIMRRRGKSETCIWRWQQRGMEEDVDGHFHDVAHPPGKAPLPVKAGSPQGRTHDCGRDGTTTLYVALNIIDGVAIGQKQVTAAENQFDPSVAIEPPD